ncbi:MAG: hypothetical protein ACK44M_04980 [Chloroflexus sp.]
MPHSSTDAGVMQRLGQLAGCRYEQALSGAIEQRLPVQVFTSFVVRSCVLREEGSLCVIQWYARLYC